MLHSLDFGCMLLRRMNILLSGQFEVGEQQVWQQPLRAALPEAHGWAPTTHCRRPTRSTSPSSRTRRRAACAACRAAADPVAVGRCRPPAGRPEPAGRGADRTHGRPRDERVDGRDRAVGHAGAAPRLLRLRAGAAPGARWQPLPQRRADSVAVLVLGLGEMGRTTALRIAANGYQVSGWSRRPACGAGDLHGIASLTG